MTSYTLLKVYARWCCDAVSSRRRNCIIEIEVKNSFAIQFFSVKNNHFKPIITQNVLQLCLVIFFRTGVSMDKLLSRVSRFGFLVESRSSHRTLSQARKCHSPAVMKPTKDEELAALLLEPPTSCCGSACNNCVWIAYAEDLSKLCKDGGNQARELIEKNVSDPNLKAFLLTELKFKFN